MALGPWWFSWIVGVERARGVRERGGRMVERYILVGCRDAGILWLWLCLVLGWRIARALYRRFCYCFWYHSCCVALRSRPLGLIPHGKMLLVAMNLGPGEIGRKVMLCNVDVAQNEGV